MASNNWYLFLRLHAILCERLAKIYERAVALADEEAKQKTNRKDSTAVALRLKPKPHIEIEDYYPAFLDMVKNLLDGNMESNTYEDTLREMFGIHAYIAFTLDKVVSHAVRQVQHCVTERTALSCTEIFYREQKKNGTGGVCASAHKRAKQEANYEKAVELMIQDENCYKIYIYKRDCRMTIEMIDTDSEEPKKIEESKKWNSYKDDFADCSNVERKPHLPLFLHRNLKKWDVTHNRRNSTNSNSKDSDSLKDKRHDKDKRDGENNKQQLNDRLEELERKLNERSQPERNQTEHPGYDVSDETQCRFNPLEAKIMYTTNKDSFLYKRCALLRARQVRINK